MIMETAIRIYTCSHEKTFKRKQKFKHKGFPVFLCKKCEKLKDEDLKWKANFYLV